MVGWHHQLNGREFEQALGDGDGQGSLVCRSPWGHKELDTTEQQSILNSLRVVESRISPRKYKEVTSFLNFRLEMIFVVKEPHPFILEMKKTWLPWNHKMS